MSRLLATKVVLTALAVFLAGVLGFLLIQAKEAREMRSRWRRNLPVDSWQAVDGRGAPVIAGVASGRFVGLYKGGSGELLWRYALDINATGRAVKAVAISADGQTIAAAATSGKIRVFDRFANQKSAFAPAQPLLALTLSGDGRRLAQVGEDGRIILSDPSGQSRGELNVVSRPVGVILSEQGDRLLVPTTKNLEAWSAAGRKLWSRPVAAKAISVAARTGEAAVVAATGRLQLYSGSGKLLWTRRPDEAARGFTQAALAGSGKLVAAATPQRIYLFDRGGRLINSYARDAKPRANIALAGRDGVLISGAGRLFSGFAAGEAVEKTAGFQAAIGWGSPAVFLPALLIGASIVSLKRQSAPGALAEVRELPKRPRRKPPRKAA